HVGPERPRGGAAVMADTMVPRLLGDERETLLLLLQYQRESLVRKVDGVSEEDARRRFVGSETSLLWLLKHVRSAEELWVSVRFASGAMFVRDDTVVPADTVASGVAAYRAQWAVTDDVVRGAASLGEACPGPHGKAPTVNLRWILAHLLEETARH